MTPKIKVSFVLPKGLHQDLQERVVLDGYGLKGKSQWVAEAVMQLFQLEHFTDLVKVNDVMQGFEKLESILIDRKLKLQLDDCVLQVRRKYPEVDGVQSRIMRTAILQRLL